MFKMPSFTSTWSDRPQPISPITAEEVSQPRGATVTPDICPYCAVGCSQLLYDRVILTHLTSPGGPRRPTA
jgi:hypothetical protein